MKTITTTQVLNKLAQSLNGVTNATEIPAPKNSTYDQVVTVLNVEGLEVSVIVFTTKPHTTNAEIDRLTEDDYVRCFVANKRYFKF